MTFPDFNPTREYFWSLIPLAISAGSVAMGVVTRKRMTALPHREKRSARVVMVGAAAGFLIGLVMFIVVIAETRANVSDAAVFWRIRSEDVTSIAVTVIQRRPETGAAVLGEQVTLTDPSHIREFLRLAEQSHRVHTSHNYFTGDGFRATLTTRFPGSRRLYMSFYNRDSRGAIVTVAVPALSEHPTRSLGQYDCEALMRSLETFFIRSQSPPTPQTSQTGR